MTQQKQRLNLLDERGSAFMEYFVIAIVVLLATIAFFQNQLVQEGVGIRGQIEDAFATMCQRIGTRPGNPVVCD